MKLRTDAARQWQWRNPQPPVVEASATACRHSRLHVPSTAERRYCPWSGRALILGNIAEATGDLASDKRPATARARD